MPLYEYYCSQCNLEIEEFLTFKDSKEINCPQCGALLERLISINNFHLKGTGWTDDSRKQRQRWYDKS